MNTEYNKNNQRCETKCVYLRLFLTLLLSLFLARFCAAASETPHLVVGVDHAITVWTGPKTTVTLYARPVGFTPTSITWAQVPDRINPLRSPGTAGFAGHGKGTAVFTVLPAVGVYQFRATARSAGPSLHADLWVQAWDNRTALDPGKTLGTGPGIAPPTSVRRLSPTPPAFQHPRVLFTDADWPELSRRDATGKVAGWGVTTIRQWVKDTLDNPQDPTGKFAAALDAWALGGMTGTPPDPAPLAGDGILSSEARGSFASMLLDACYLQWLDNDPRTDHALLSAAARQRGAYLARLTAAAAKLRLDAVWDRSTGKFHNDGPLAIRNLDQPGEPPETPGLCDLALAYDLIYDWMDDTQRQAGRDFLFAAGWGRHTSFGGWDRGTLRLGSEHNGDFGNLSDYEGLVGLAVEGEEESVSPEARATFGHAMPGSVEERWVRPAVPRRPGGLAERDRGLGGQRAAPDRVAGAVVYHALGYGVQPSRVSGAHRQEHAASHPGLFPARREFVCDYPSLPGRAACASGRPSQRNRQSLSPRPGRDEARLV